MVKTVIKEIFIILLLLIAIVLIFGVILYDYVPTRKTIPNKVAYETPNEIENELVSAEIQDTNPVNVMYEIDATELEGYEITGEYKAGRSNPFESLSSGGQNNTAGSNTGGQGGSTTRNRWWGFINK